MKPARVHSLYVLTFISLQSPEEDEEEDFRVLPTDNLLAIGKAEEDYSSVEVHGKSMCSTGCLKSDIQCTRIPTNLPEAKSGTNFLKKWVWSKSGIFLQIL